MSAETASPGAWRETLLRERAKRLAARPAEGAETSTRRVCLCEARGRLFGLPVEAIARVMPDAKTAPLANADPALLGIIGRGGGFALIYDLAALISGERPERTNGGHLVFLRQSDPLVGLKVSRTIAVDDIEMLTPDEAINLPSRAGISAYGRHGDNRIVSIIDIASLLDRGAGAHSGG
jgi:chemotaxis signal transduction protein